MRSEWATYSSSRLVQPTLWALFWVESGNAAQIRRYVDTQAREEGCDAARGARPGYNWTKKNWRKDGRR